VVFLKERKVENEVIELKATKGLLRIEIDVVTRFSQKIFRFRNYIQSTNLTTPPESKYELFLPLAICIINNTSNREVNVMSIYTHLKATYVLALKEEHKQLRIKCSDIQVDNNTKQYVYFPVVLRTNFELTLTGKKDTWLELELQVGKINLRLEEDFVYEVYSLFLLL
jgi:hypothetical protein